MRLGIAGWAEAAGFAACILLFISGDSGRILVYAIAAAVVLSVVTCLISRKRFSLRCKGCEGLHGVGDKVTVELELAPKGFCLLPYITVSGSFLGQRFTACGAVLGKKSSVKITLTAAECGLSRFEVDSVTIRDFLGLLYLNSPVRPEAVRAAVLPRIVEYTGPEVPLALLPSDDDEDSAQSQLVGGLPGYEHRDYVPGDPLRRINYKLSAKKRRLLVRRDDNIAAESIDIILAPSSDGECAEQALALARKLISAGGTARLVCGGDSFTAGYSALGKLREWLAFRDYSNIGAPAARSSAALMRTTVVISPAGITIS